MNLRKYFIMGSQNCSDDPAAILKLAINAGITAFQFREKGADSLSGEAKVRLGRELRSICADNNIPFFVNDDAELVDVLQADGIHVGQDDLSIAKIKEQFPDKLIGLSVSNVQEVSNSPIHLADYLGAGPIFSTSSKDDAKAAVGTEWIETLRTMHPKMPIVGIGGITTANASAVIKAGADGVAVISSITQAEDITEAVKAL